MKKLKKKELLSIYTETVNKMSGRAISDAFQSSTVFQKKRAGKTYAETDLTSKTLLSILANLARYSKEGRTVLVDSPESVFPPSVQSMFTQFLEGMAKETGVTFVVMTDSPLVLQNLRGERVFVARGWGEQLLVGEPRSETFGGSVEQVYDEVLGVEMSESGWYKKVEKAAENSTFEEALDSLGNVGQLAPFVLRAMTLHN